MLVANHDDPLCNAWSYTQKSGILNHNGVFYEIYKVAGTLTERLFNTEDWNMLPQVSAPGVTIFGDEIRLMTLEEVQAREKEVDEEPEDLIEQDDGSWWTKEESENAQKVLASETFKSLPLVKYDQSIHHAKVIRSMDELQNLIALKGCTNVIQIIGRTEAGQVLTRRFGQGLSEWIIDRSLDVPEEWKYQWILDVVTGLSQLHGKNILHKDLSINNVLYDKNHAVICDIEAGPDTIFQYPPECILGKPYTAKSDIFEFGQLLWSIENRNMPRAFRTLECSGVFADLMQRCLADDPDVRPTIDQVLQEVQQRQETASHSPLNDLHPAVSQDLVPKVDSSDFHSTSEQDA
ncbi:uncharacterized protein I206_105036 [Kwoniella pini CBS 10737]|uniref:TKL protein kinase n=1 Tax=Kwoniella pini CBS 10737 TaxID=1296096 RepID=A0A1B9I8M1_9TREE|nr:TKL protein kinase [Kwoniella pini CBS 10737]OCF51860.1 TKL protein kinase [Kwoniella pini CBS 10737]